MAAPIALVVNRHSRSNRRDPGQMHRLATVLDGTGQMHSPDKDGLVPLAEDLARHPPAVLAIHGGDGTVHHILSALIPAFARAGSPVPPIALLTGGTMNVVPRSLGLQADPETFLRFVAEATRRGTHLDTVPRRCLQVGDRFGFVFANGVFASFLEAYYAPGSYGSWRAMLVLVRAIGSSLIRGAYARKNLRPYRGLVTVGGEPMDRDTYTAVTSSTVSQIGMGFKLNHRADEDIDRFSLVAVKSSPVALMADLLSILRGRGLSPRRADTRLVADMTLTPSEEMAYTVDGDLYRTDRPLVVRPGPLLQLVKPG